MCSQYRDAEAEILTLTWPQVRNSIIYLQKTKTNESREIPINDELEKMFSEIRREQKPGTEMVFIFARGEHNLKGEEPVRKRQGLAPVAEAITSIKSSSSAAVARAGIKDFKFHDLHHTFASQLVMRGANLKVQKHFPTLESESYLSPPVMSWTFPLYRRPIMEPKGNQIS